MAAVKRGYGIHKQAEVDKMAADIEAAVKALVKKPAKPEPQPEQMPAGKPSNGLPTTGDISMIAVAASAIAGVGALAIARKRH